MSLKDKMAESNPNAVQVLIEKYGDDLANLTRNQVKEVEAEIDDEFYEKYY